MKDKIKIMMDALEEITKAREDSPVKTYQRMEDIAKEAIAKVK